MEVVRRLPSGGKKKVRRRFGSTFLAGNEPSHVWLPVLTASFLPSLLEWWRRVDESFSTRKVGRVSRRRKRTWEKRPSDRERNARVATFFARRIVAPSPGPYARNRTTIFVFVEAAVDCSTGTLSVSYFSRPSSRISNQISCLCFAGSLTSTDATFATNTQTSYRYCRRN